jgi:UDP-GlcNAc:undecaprenyl-phosphate/decaprenyl-phosphate GlcNAc-1-phosphate transferase
MLSLFNYIFQYKYMLAGCAFLVSVCISYSIYPVILYLNHKKHLSQIPNKRSSHIVATPTLGGV